MPVPALPVITGFALRYGMVALATYAFTRTVRIGRWDQSEEDAHDKVEEGVSLRREPGQINTTGRFHRIIRLGKSGPGIEIDASGFGRVKFRKTD
ncbi:hypothetical protein [Thalassobius sp. I31.1]|uniref:hypothetical protein n=1 Tax=Thalassobius sp. I31.1 TaxID=2109912 RepID=UPI000D199A3B|nr:hypothetical protein [Thalassobius sp. I31.1]